MSNDINEVLAQRGNRYGDFSDHAKITQELKIYSNQQLSKNENFKVLDDITKMTITESLDMIYHKIGRILNGDPAYDDSWIDIGGYAKLVADHLNKGK